METIGLIAAMSSESKALLRNVRGWKRTRVGPFRGIRFKIAERDCIMVTSGMGVQRAAEAARVLIEKFQPAWMVSFGIAGAVREDLKIGDVVMACQSCRLDKGLLSPFQPLAALSKEAFQAAEEALSLRGRRFIPGTAITTRGSQLISQQSMELENPILEMETAGVLQATKANGIPLFVIRSVSDGPLAPVPFDLEMIMDDNYNLRPDRLLLAMLKQPRLLFQSGQMMKNNRIAADNAAIAVAAVLSQSLYVISQSN